MNNYNEEQKKDIQERIDKVNVFLKENQLAPVIQIIPTETKDGNIISSLVIVLQDTKYLPEEQTQETPKEVEEELETVIPQNINE